MLSIFSDHPTVHIDVSKARSTEKSQWNKGYLNYTDESQLLICQWLTDRKVVYVAPSTQLTYSYTLCIHTKTYRIARNTLSRVYMYINACKQRHMHSSPIYWIPLVQIKCTWNHCPLTKKNVQFNQSRDSCWRLLFKYFNRRLIYSVRLYHRNFDTVRFKVLFNIGDFSTYGMVSVKETALVGSTA